jgi:hypothetical protein
MFGSRFFESRLPTRSLFDSDPFFTHPSGSTRSEEKDYSQNKDDTVQSRGTEPQTSTPTPPSTADTSNTRRRSGTGLGRESQQQQMRPYRDPYEQQLMMPGWDDWSGFGRWGGIGGGFGMMDSMMNRMERLLHRVDQVEDPDWSSLPVGDGVNSSYSCSSSSYSQSGADGKPAISHSTSREVRRVGDVLEEVTHYEDSNGNERTMNKRGIAKQMREVITDRNGRGEERKVENLRGIQPSEVQQFDQKWQEATNKFDPQHKLLGRGSLSQQQSLPSGTTQAQITSSNEKRDIPVASEKTLGKTDQQQATPQRKTSKSGTTAV